MPRAYPRDAMHRVCRESPSAPCFTRTRVSVGWGLRDLPHPGRATLPNTGDKFVGGLSCFFELSFTWSARSASVCAPCLAAYEHSALLHTGLSGRFGIGRSTRCTGKIYHFAHNRARKCFVLLLNADVSRAVGHVGAPGLSFTWRTTRSSLRRPYPG